MARESLDFENLFSMVENMLTGVCIFEYDKGKRTFTPVYINEGCFRMLGYSSTEGMKYARNLLSTILVEDREIFWQGIHDILQDDGAVDFEFRTVTAQGALRWLQVRGNLYAREGSLYTISGIVIDATERKNIEEELQEQAERLNIISQSGGELIFDYNARTDVMTIKANHKIGFHQDIIIEKYVEEQLCTNIYEEDRESYLDVLRDALKTVRRDSIDVRANYMKTGDYIWYRMDLTSLTGMEGYVTRIIGRMTDINDKKLKEMELEIKAEKDSLTGLYNKGATRQLIEQKLAEKEDGKIHALMIVDLDNFKQVNDQFGHARGDEVLQYAAEQISNTFKRRDIVGRIGGDEFVVFVSDIGMISNTDILATRLCRLLDQKVEGDGMTVHVTGSIGIAVIPYHGNDYETLFHKADKALYAAKAEGKDGYRIFDGMATITYHNTRRESNYTAVEQKSAPRDLMDKIFQILFEDRNRVSAIRSAIEMIAVRCGMQGGFLDSQEKFGGEQICFCADGYPHPLETEEGLAQRRAVLEECCRTLGAFCVIHDYDEAISDNVRAYMQRRGARMMIVQTISVEGSPVGYIVLENYADSEYDLAQEERLELRYLFRILAMYALELTESDSVCNNIARIEMMDNFDSYAYAVDADTHRLYFINKKVMRETPQINIGDLCYRALQGKDSPCEDCILKKMDRASQHCSLTEERFNFSLRMWNRVMASWLECREEHPVALLNCVDISEYFIG